jgi:hypothetical protein
VISRYCLNSLIVCFMFSLLGASASPDWAVEEFNDKASIQLEVLKSYFKGNAETLPVDASVFGFSMESVFDQAGFKVSRAKEFAGKGMMADLRSRFPKGAAEQVQFKTVKVDISDGSIRSEIHGHLSGGGLQVNFVWDTQWTKDRVPKLETVRTVSYEECERSGDVIFQDGTGSVMPAEANQLTKGMDYWVAHLETLFGVEVSAWHGIAVADVNGDGRDDVYVSDAGGLPNRLLVQNEDGTLKDVSVVSGMDWLEHTLSTTFADLDNDGDQDAAIAFVTGVMFLENDGTGKFAPRYSKYFPAAAPYGLAMADYDADGDLDVFVTCYVSRHAGGEVHSVVARPTPYMDATNGGRNEVLRNEGNWYFRNVTKAVGIVDDNTKFSYSGSWDDYDGDGDMDIYIANDFGGNYLYQNQLKESGAAMFKEVAEQMGVRDVAAGMSVCWGDYNNDGLPDLYVGNMFSSAGNRIAFQDQFQANADKVSRGLFQRHARGNSLFRNLGGGKFEDVSEPAGVTMGRWAWSSLFTDFNNDGWEDILVANGFITQEDTGDL